VSAISTDPATSADTAATTAIATKAAIASIGPF
jgi:hypothetical protein